MAEWLHPTLSEPFRLLQSGRKYLASRSLAGAQVYGSAAALGAYGAYALDTMLALRRPVVTSPFGRPIITSLHRAARGRRLTQLAPNRRHDQWHTRAPHDCGDGRRGPPRAGHSRRQPACTEVPALPDRPQVRCRTFRRSFFRSARGIAYVRYSPLLWNASVTCNALLPTSFCLRRTWSATWLAKYLFSSCDKFANSS